MPFTSKSNRRKPKKRVQKLKQRWRVKQPTRNWLDLPADVTANILYRIGVFNILENAQKVCTTWHKICKDPAMWRVIKMHNHGDPNERPPLQDMCRHAVDLSQGQLVDLTIVDFCSDDLLEYVAERSSQLKRLEIACCYGDIWESWTEYLKKFPLLEELSLYITDISKEGLESAGRFCPLLKTLKVNQQGLRMRDRDNDDESMMIYNEMAIAIGENMHELRHLELIGDSMSNIGLQAILDGCRHLESLDLRQCWYVDLKGELGKRCSEQIKDLRLPYDSLEGCPYIYEDYQIDEVGTEAEMFLDDSDDEYYGFFDYDDFSDYDDFTAFGGFMACGDDDDGDSIDLEDLYGLL